MFCGNCGVQLADNINNCPSCGWNVPDNSVKSECPSCGSLLDLFNNQLSKSIIVNNTAN
jgi:predicted RNA-binding Zn-ribbon protein involved in translation (DUF1610 family)